MLRSVRSGFVLVAFAALLAAGCAGHHDGTHHADDAMSGGGMDGGGEPPGEKSEQEGRVCGGIQGLPCDEGWFCQLEPGSCDSADLQGICVEIPRICTKEYLPVCGCDGKTYGNDCTRRAAAVQKDHDGEC